MECAPDWEMRRGTSGAGWDIYACLHKHDGTLRLFWRPLTCADDSKGRYRAGRRLRSWKDLEDTMTDIGQAIHRGAFDVSMVEDPLLAHPFYGRF